MYTELITVMTSYDIYVVFPVSESRVLTFLVFSEAAFPTAPGHLRDKDEFSSTAGSAR